MKKKSILIIIILLMAVSILYTCYNQTEKIKQAEVSVTNPNEDTEDTEIAMGTTEEEEVEEMPTPIEEQVETDKKKSLSLVTDIVDFDPFASVDLRDLSYFERKISVVPVRLDELYIFDKDNRGAQGISFYQGKKVENQTLVASGGWSNDLYVWDYLTQELKYKIDEAHDSDIMVVKFNEDGKYIFTAGLDKKIKVWDTNTGRMIREFGPYKKGVIGLDMYETRDKIMMAAALLTGEVLYIDFYAKQLIHTFQHPPYVTSVTFDFDGEMLASTGKDGFVRLWDLKTKNQIRAFNHKSKVTTVAFDPIGDFIVSGAWDNKAKVWDIYTGELIFLLDAHTAAIEVVQFDPSGDFIIVGARDGFVSVWESATGASAVAYDTGAERVYNVTFDKRGELMGIAGYDHTVRVYHLEDEAERVIEIIN